ncbi:MAG: CDP-alcohol phosphatidyltransferase family protein [Thiohalocapsa sp.]|jgi:CDP-diacylglycerol--glycerol-3-phosphate 3-phosphatidyltransferase|uniref:CDP-alcohol phosphatidyltransferase family protein n=1 Tax=Thiohalocapsa sp. TaxID=2497641 RepID=UPI0025E3F540|nr:CDP-alcohol phosphatidyltransferase family protein [Thiohalocapsa sp.]
MRDLHRWQLPNLLSAFRLVAAPVLLLLALQGHREAFLWLLAVAFFTDAIDGTLARLTGQASRFGAMLDSWADVAVYAAVAVSMLLLWPGLVREEGIAFGAVVASFVVPALVGLLRFRRFTSYHTRLVKVAVAASAVGLFLLLLDLAAWPFRVAAVLATLAALEEIAITLVLDEERSNVGSLLHVLRARRRRDDARG